MNILIIGGGVAAFEAGLAASAASSDHHVTICSKEGVLPYRRPALSRMVSEQLSDTAFYFKDQNFYAERNIQLLLNKEAVSIDREKQEVLFKDNSVLPYDRLILATGGNQQTADTVLGCIMQGAAVIAYIVGEGLVDTENAQYYTPKHEGKEEK